MIAIVFPGQGSQKPGMGAELWDLPEGRKVADGIRSAVGVDVRKLTQETDEETLRQTQNAQMALYACGVAAHACLGVEAQAMAGHSIGEYAALASSGMLSVADGARLVQRRGELMAASGKTRPGGMAAVLGLERAILEDVCRSVDSGVAVVANDNCPGQLVISGDAAAVQEASLKATEAGAKRVLPLNVSGAFHSPLMEDSAREMRQALDPVAFRRSEIRVYSNVTAKPNPDPEIWPMLLEDQLRNPVRWTEIVQNMIEDGVTTFIECGAGEVLCGLIRRIDKSVTTLAANDRETLGKAKSSA